MKSIRTEDPERAASLERSFYQSGSWPDMSKVVKTVIKQRAREKRVPMLAKNWISFKRYYAGAGFKPTKVADWWQRNVDHKGRPLKVVKNEQKEKCLLMNGDESYTDVTSTGVQLTGQIAKHKHSWEGGKGCLRRWSS